MENITELLKTIDPGQLDEALAVLKRLKEKQTPQRHSKEAEPANGALELSRSSQTALNEGPQRDETDVTQSSLLRTEPCTEGASYVAIEEDDVPLASLAHLLSPEEKKVGRDSRKAERELERETRRRMREEETAFIRVECEARRLINEEEKESRRSMKDAERDARKAEKESEKEARRKAREEEQEAEREARHRAREAEKEALKTPKPAANSLALFGFRSNTVKIENNKNKLFSLFVQDKRVAPAALQFWMQPEDRKTQKEGEHSVLSILSHTTARADARRDLESSRSHFMDEESSLLHPPMCVDEAARSKTHICVRDFNAMIEASHASEIPTRDLLCQCGCLFHTTTSDPYPSFDSEVVFTGFFAIGYDPCQSRPPYFGTYNHLQEGNLNETELLQMGRFAVGEGIPRLSNIDYEYDSGDDWDVMDGDEDIAASSSGDSEEEAELRSLDSSDLEFINDDDDDDDSDCDIQRKIMEARQRRLNRLRNKDKLVPSYSGPFIDISADEHPLRGFDELERFVALDAAYFSALLQNELSAFLSSDAGVLVGDDAHLTADEVEAKRQQALMEAALKNRREMTDSEVKALHTLIGANSKVSAKMIVGALQQQHLCVGVARVEIERTIKRFYERRHGSLLQRTTPWSPTDERLFTRASSSKKLTAAQDGDGVKEGGEGDKDEDDSGDVGAEENRKQVRLETSCSITGEKEVLGDGRQPSLASLDASKEAGHPAPLPRSSREARGEGAAPKGKQKTLMELLPKKCSTSSQKAKRSRETDTSEDQDGGVRVVTEC